MVTSCLHLLQPIDLLLYKQVQQKLPAAHFNAPGANSSINSHSIGAQNQQVAASQAHLANLKAAQARVQQVVLANQCHCINQTLDLPFVACVKPQLLATLKHFDVLH